MKQTYFLSLFLLLIYSNLLEAQNQIEEGMDKVFHTSDIEGEVATQANRRKQQMTQILPEGSYRVGCVCMTGEVRSTTSTGSCSGQGGVRYWLVVNAAGDTVQYATGRQALNADNEPIPYIGPNPQMRYTTQPPTIIIMPQQGNALTDATPQYPQRQDTQNVWFRALSSSNDTLLAHQMPGALTGLPLVFDSLIQLCIVLVICGTLVIIVKMFMQQGNPPGTDSLKIFRNIRLTLIKILFRNNRFK